VPVELSPSVLRGALRELGEREPGAERMVEDVLSSIAGREEEHEPLVLSRYELQLFLWYEMPRKWLAEFDGKRALVRALASFLELAGEPVARWAQVCRSPQTDRLLGLWEREERDHARKLLRELLDSSGPEPSETELLQWGSVMGPVQPIAHRNVAYTLEEAVEDGRLVPGSRAFKRRQSELVVSVLSEPSQELDGRSMIDAIRQERFERWARRGSPQHSHIIGGIADLLQAPAPGADYQGALEPLRWLLDQASGDGIALTQTHALNRALVHAAVERFPNWWNSELFAPPPREAELGALCEVHDLARRMRLLRRTGRRLVLTASGGALRSYHRGLFEAVARNVLAEEGFAAAVQELAAAILLREGEIDWEKLDRTVHGAIVSDGWHAEGAPPSIRAIRSTIAELVWPARALGLIAYDRGALDGRLSLTESGHSALHIALHTRAAGPAGYP